MTIPIHHGVGDAGHTVDHNAISDVLTAHGASLATLTTAVTGVFYLAGNNVTTITDGTSYGWRVNLPVGARDTAPSQLAFFIGGKQVGAFNSYGELTATPALPSRPALVVNAYDVTQTADLQQWKNSAGTVIAAVRPDGSVFGKNVTASTWTNLTLSSGITRHSAGHRPQYRVRDDRVEFRGMLAKTSGNFTASPVTLGTMPAGLVPGALQDVICASSFNSNYAWVRVEVTTSGSIVAYIAIGVPYTPSWISLDNFTYVLGPAS